MVTFYDEQLKTRTSLGSSISLNFNTNPLENSKGDEERTIKWLSPFLNFELSRNNLTKDWLDYLKDFFRTTRANSLGFRYRDCLDYQATATVKDNVHGSSTQGILFPEPDGTRTEFQLYKLYMLGGCIHYRAITRPDKITVYEDGAVNNLWNLEKGKITFLNPPTGSLTTDFTFDVPVTFAKTNLEFQVNILDQSSKNFKSQTFSLEEIREDPYDSVIDEFGELPTFNIFRWKKSVLSFKDDVEVVNLRSDYDLRTTRYRAQKSRFTSESAEFKTEELEHLITFWRCAKGKGLSFPIIDRTDNYDYLMVRFDTNELNLSITGDGNFRFNNLSLAEVFEELPVSLRFANNPNISVQQTIFQPGTGADSFPSQSISLVETTPTLDPENINGIGGNAGNGQGYFILKTSISMSSDCSQRLFA